MPSNFATPPPFVPIQVFPSLSKVIGEKYAVFNSGLPDNDVYPITFDKDGNTWIGTNGGGVAKFDGTTRWTVYNKSNSGLPDDNVYSMTIDEAGIIWIGTVEGGLAKF